MGEVYKARDTRLDRTVAIKVLPSAFATDRDRRERFRREARAVSELTHPHMCTLYDVGEHDGLDYLVMEHLAGSTLAERLRRGPLLYTSDVTGRFEVYAQEFPTAKGKWQVSPNGGTQPRWRRDLAHFCWTFLKMSLPTP